MVVIALPLIGKSLTPVYERRESILRGSGFAETRSMGVDLAVLSTGRTTGTQSRLVPGDFDTTRLNGIIDVTLLTVDPDNMNAESIGRLLAN